MESSGYKKDPRRRAHVVQNLPGLLLPEGDILQKARDSDDAMDALVCVQAGVDFLLDDVDPPKGEARAKLAQKEGWIWVKVNDASRDT